MGINVSRRSILAAAPVAGLSISTPALSGLTCDPLYDVITEYRKQVAVFADIPDGELTKDNEESYVQATYGPPMKSLLVQTPQATSLRGVREAIKLTLDEDALIDQIAKNALRSALAYLETIS